MNLKPINCPLCNAQSKVSSGRYEHNYKLTICCTNCCVKLEKTVHHSHATGYDLIEYLSNIRRELIIQWNTRIKN